MTSIDEEKPNQEVGIAKTTRRVGKLGGVVLDRLESMPADVEREFLRHVFELKPQSRRAF